MLISIIVPVYNNEKTIERCINSILSQSFKDWELILIDDGSSDRSGEICDILAATDCRIKTFHQSNGGVSKARNLGLNVSKGEWVTFCDSDDELQSGALDSYLANIEDGIDLIRAGFLRIKGNTSVKISTVKSIESNKATIIEKCNDSHYEAYIWNSCFRRSVVGEIRFNESISWCEDHLFTFSVISKSQFVAFIPEIVYKYYAPLKGDSFSEDNLSTRYIEPNSIIRGAVEERDIKLGMCENSSEDCLRLIKEEFEYKVNFALRYAIAGNKIFTGLYIFSKYSSSNFIQFLSLILHMKIFPCVRQIKYFKTAKSQNEY